MTTQEVREDAKISDVAAPLVAQVNWQLWIMQTRSSFSRSARSMIGQHTRYSTLTDASWLVLLLACKVIRE